MKRPPDFQTQIGDAVWSVRFVRKGHKKIPQCWGMCYWDDKEIYIRYDMAATTVRDTLIHEMLHANCGLMYAAEEWVTQFATQLERGLNKAGM